ncbi:GAF domain-containing protein [Paucibacter sp. R3-3]|uniref:GAF domain-containing protein n=1 Tax=Roseateles agri TaxID=3098619 RepID=A0ABU5DDL8_9BURK|nr:GAF domain-containing protein [Paucibacter sp. R3-3]MDY0744380.1 GAF domain-containing protein [Paucibacter sp. R3-3]
MTPAPIPDDEAERLQALEELLLLDTPPDERYDRVVRFAAEQLDMPVALVSLVDGRRQWFKSRLGLEASETSRDISFCGHAIMSPELFVVEDASRDPRFADNPLVTGDLHLRFYAGAPISTPGGHRIGTLCVIDSVPRQLGPVELAVLDALRELVNEALAGGGDEGLPA